MNIERIKLYHFPMSRSVRIKWLLLELIGNNFDLEQLALYEGQQYQDQYLQRNPNHAVPVLDFTLDDGSVFSMIESGAMVSLLADLYPDKNLAPAAKPFSTARADYLQMLHFASSWMDMMLWQLRLHIDLFGEAERDERTIARYKDKISKEVEPQLKARLDNGNYICGEQFCAVDCVVGHNILWAKMYGLCTDPVFAQYLRKLAERPAYQAAFADRDQFKASPH
jgi:glutathione S-transferase